eukprot:gene46051-53020_t
MRDRQGGFLRMSDGWRDSSNTPVVCSVYRLWAPAGRRWAVRSSPSEASEVLWTVSSDAKLGFSEQRDGFFRIASGWCIESLFGGGWRASPRDSPRSRAISPAVSDDVPPQPQRRHPMEGPPS